MTQMEAQAHLPLKGVRVLELAQIMAGPTCGLMLADLGAEVIKIEKFTGDDARQYQKPGDTAVPPSFQMINRGKRSLALDVRTPEGKAVVEDLVRQCDVLTENFRVGVMDRLGLGYEALRAINPALIYCSITGYGSVGPMAQAGGFDLILQAFSGLIQATGEEGRQSVKPGVSIADTNAGILAALGIVAAYVHRLRTGKGQKVETSLLQAAMQQTYWLSANYLSSGQVPKPLGTAHSLIAPYQVFQAADGELVIGGGNPTTWKRICEVLGHPEWHEDERFSHPQRRVAHRKDLEHLINEALARGTVAQWCQRFEAAQVPAGPVHHIGQALEHSQTNAVGMLVDIDAKEGQQRKSLGFPISLDRHRGAHALSAAPDIGEHSREILKEFGFNEERIEQLIRHGVVAA